MVGKIEQTDLEFFRGNGVKNVLKRYNFSQQEKDLLYAAMATAKKNVPNMTTLFEATELLKKIAQERQPLEQKNNVQVHIEDLPKSLKSDTVKQIKIVRNIFLGFLFLFFLALFIALKDPFKIQATYFEAQSYCNKKQMRLPHNENEIKNAHFLDQIFRTRFWMRDHKIYDRKENLTISRDYPYGYASVVCVHKEK